MDGNWGTRKGMISYSEMQGAFGIRGWSYIGLAGDL